MTAVADGPADGALPRERGWRRLMLAVAVAAAISTVGSWPPALSLVALGVYWLLPVPWFGALVLVALAACAVAAWSRGGRLVPALLASLLVAVWVWRGGRRRARGAPGGGGGPAGVGGGRPWWRLGGWRWVCGGGSPPVRAAR